ncbi:GDSL-type esterase/lipase family protein [Sutcliffiella halmapala]|uniref:GDSL-type esterase/lipase family protein n=1 Tax=Sutcliffiella halmapala TaxID=79882 RepID=UPI000994B89E|nr:GDSL-type esterase/lipase family protein [Sutcliffiella halmapala]
MRRKILLAAFLLFASFSSYPPVTAESPKQLTYLALGDSLTVGLGSSEEGYLRIHGFVPQFTNYLRTKHTVHVENYGIPGLTATGLVALLQGDEALRNRLKTANIITVSIGGNDFLQTVRSLSHSDDEALQLRMQILWTSLEQISSTLQQVNSEATIMFIGLYNPYPTQHELHKIGAKYAPLYNELIEEVTPESTIVINPYESFVNREKELTHIINDNIHPNDSGYKEIVALMKKAY